MIWFMCFMFHSRNRSFFFFFFFFFFHFRLIFSLFISSQKLELSLHEAIQTQNRDRLPELLSREIIDVNEIKNMKKPLTLAVEKQDIETVRGLLKRGAIPTFSFEKEGGESSDIFLDFGRGVQLRESQEEGDQERVNQMGKRSSQNLLSKKTISSKGITTTITTNLSPSAPLSSSTLWETLFSFFHYGFLPPLSSSFIPSLSFSFKSSGENLLNGLSDPFLSQTFTSTRTQNLPPIVSFPLKSCTSDLLQVLPIIGRSMRVSDLIMDGRDGFDRFVDDEELFYLRLHELVTNLGEAGGKLKSLCLINCQGSSYSKTLSSRPSCLFVGHQLAKILKKTPNLQTLLLTNGAYLPIDQPTPFPKSLLHLDLSNNPCPPFLLPTPSLTIHLPASLTVLCLSGVLPRSSPSKELQYLSSHIVARVSKELENLPHLTSLDLSSNPFSRDHFRLLSSSLSSLSALTRLNLKQTGPSPQSLQSLLASISRAPLSDLVLSQNPLGVSSTKNIFLFIKNCPTFRKLSLFGCDLGNEGFEEVFRWLQLCPHLDDLDLGANDITSLPSPLVVPLLHSPSCSAPVRKFKSFKFAVNSLPDVHRLLSVIQARSLDLGGNAYPPSQLDQIVKRLWFDGYTQHLRISDSLDFFGRVGSPFLSHGSLLTLELGCSLEESGRIGEGGGKGREETKTEREGVINFVSLSTPLFSTLPSPQSYHSEGPSVSEPSLPPSPVRPLRQSSLPPPPPNLLFCDAFPSLSHSYRRSLLSFLTPNSPEWRWGEVIEERLRMKEYRLIAAILEGDLVGVVKEWEEDERGGKGGGMNKGEGGDSFFRMSTREMAKSLGFPLFIDWVLRKMAVRGEGLVVREGRGGRGKERLSVSEGGANTGGWKEGEKRRDFHGRETSPPPLLLPMPSQSIARTSNTPTSLKADKSLPPSRSPPVPVLDLRSLHLSEWHLESLLLLLASIPLTTLDLRSNRPLHRIPRCLALRMDTTRILLDTSSLHPIERKVYQKSQGFMERGLRQHLLDCMGITLSLKGLGLQNDHLLDLDFYRAKEVDLRGNPGITQIPRLSSLLRGGVTLKIEADQFLPIEREVYKRSGGRGEEMVGYLEGLKEGKLDLKGLELEEGEIEESLVGLGFIERKDVQQEDRDSMAGPSPLTSLDLRNNPLINRIPLFLKDLPRLTNLSLDHTNPIGLFERSQYQTLSLAELRTYVATLSSRPQKKLRQLKCMVIGRAASGKTTLVRRLRGENFDGKVEQTDGIDIGQLFLSPSQSVWSFLGWGGGEGGRGDRAITLSTWDFGGQKMYRYVLSPPSFFLLSLNPLLF